MSEFVPLNKASPEQIDAAKHLLVIDLEATCDDANRMPTSECGATIKVRIQRQSR